MKEPRLTKTNKRSISAIIPTFNAERFIVQTLDSILGQQLGIDELVISDDDSNDRTIELIEQHLKGASFAVKILSHKPNGPTANYLNAIRHTTGDIIIVSDQDDVWLDHRVKRIVSVFEDSNISLSCHDSLLVNAELQSLETTIRGGIIRSKKLSNKINQSNNNQHFRYFLQGGLSLLAHTLAFRKDLIPMLLDKPADIAGWWFEEWLSSVAILNGRIELISEHLLLYRQHASQSSGGLINNNNKASHSKYTLDLNTPSKYHLRIEKIKYCRKLVWEFNTKDQTKYQTLSNYIEFLEKRDSILGVKSPIRRLPVIMRLLFSGNYHRFARGIKSACLDLISFYKIR